MLSKQLKELEKNILNIIRTKELDRKTEQAILQFSATVKNVYESTLVLQLADKDKPMNTFDAHEVAERYGNFLKQGKDLVESLKKANLDDPELNGLITPIENLSIPIDHHYQALQNPEGKTFSSIENDLSWIPQLLVKDPNALQKVKNDQATSEAQEFGQLENIEKGMKLYKLMTDEAEKKYNAHYSKVLGSDNILGSLEYKCNLVSSVVEKIYGNGAVAQEIKLYPQAFKRVDEAFVKGKQTENFSPLNERKLDFINMIFDAPTFEGNGQMEGISKENVSALSSFLSQLNPRSYLLGITTEQVDALGQTSVLITQMQDIKEGFKVTEGRKDINGLELPELKGLADTISDFEKKSYDYVVKGKGEPPTAEDVAKIMDSISEYMNGDIELSTEGKIGIFETAYILGKGINTYAAGFEDKFKEIKGKYDKVVLSEFERQKELIESGPVEDIEKLMSNIIDLSNSDAKIPQDEYDKVYKIALLRNPDFRKKQYDMAMSQLNSIKEIENYTPKDLRFAPVNRETWKELPKNELVKKIAQVVAVCEFADKQEEKMVYNNNVKARSITEGVIAGYNQALYEGLTENSLSEEQVQALEDIVDGINNNPKLNDLFTVEPKHVAEVLTYDNRKNMDSMLHGEDKFNVFYGMKETDVACLLEDRKVHKNSNSFNEMRNSIAELNKAKENIGGPQPENYIQVFKAAQNYLNMHDSNPSTSWGKERFDAACKLMANAGTKLIKECPEMKEEIEKSFKLAMMRSENFREYVVGKMVNDKTIDQGFKKEMFDSAALVTEVLKEEYGKSFISGKPSDQKDGPKIAEIFQKVYEGDRALQRRYPDAPKEEVQKQDEGIAMH